MDREAMMERMEERRQEVYQRAELSEEQQTALNEDIIAKPCLPCVKSIKPVSLILSKKSSRHCVTLCTRCVRTATSVDTVRDHHGDSAQEMDAEETATE